MQLFHELVYDGLNVDILHAERTPAQREATVNKFRAGKVWVLIATELIARGMVSWGTRPCQKPLLLSARCCGDSRCESCCS